MRKQHEMSVFNNHGLREYNPLKIARRFSRNMKHAYQRITRGYCDADVWSVDSWFLRVVPDMLDQLAETTHGCPAFMDENGTKGVPATGENPDNSFEKWIEILHEMAFHFREADEDTCSIKNRFEEEWEKTIEEKSTDDPEYEEVSGKYWEETKRIGTYRNEQLNEGLEMFKKWFWDLWD